MMPNQQTQELNRSQTALKPASQFLSDEKAFALNIKHALNDSANALPQSTLDKLYAARRKAVAARHEAQQDKSVFKLAQTWLSAQFKMLGAPLAMTVPAFIVGVGLYMMSTNNADNYVQTVAEIDTQVLSQELPIDALLDKGFVRYVQLGE